MRRNGILSYFDIAWNISRQRILYVRYTLVIMNQLNRDECSFISTRLWNKSAVTKKKRYILPDYPTQNKSLGKFKDMFY